MSAFSKVPATNLLVCVLRPYLPRQATRSFGRSTRSFGSLGPLRQAHKPQRPASAPPKTPSPKQSPRRGNVPPPGAAARLTNSTTAYAYVKQLAQRGGPTTLYEAPSHAWMKFGSWSTSLFCIGYATYSVTFYTNPPEGLAWWVGPSYSVIAIAFAVVGTVLLLRTSGIVKSIRALPTATGPVRGAAAGVPTRPRLDLEITVKSTLPLMGPRVVVVPFSDVSMGSRIVMPDEYLSPVERLERKKAEEKRREESRKYEMAHLLSAPFRHAWRGAGSAMRGMRQLFTGSGFGTVVVNGTTYRLDVSNAWMLDDGKALDRLLRVVGLDDKAQSNWSKLYM